ncbi:class A beta-lactamase [Granulicella sp. L60]|uniref:class A beta-lactamase n=1 Tax=Granulicella sp. L60 TaxID=1641866 RepID=UPI00131D05EB|nr:class A beta-lactamase [Granulicella sp. L60]
MRPVLLLPPLLSLLTTPAPAQQSLQQQIQTIAADAHGKVSVACSLPDTMPSPSPLNCDLNPTAHPPMQSVFKLPLALTILHQLEQGKFMASSSNQSSNRSIDQPIRFLPEDRILPKPYSSLQDKYPNANVDVPLRTLLQLTVSLSDNTAADILLRIAGGPDVVDKYIASLGITGFHLRDGENALHHSVPLQYRNWFEPRSAVQLLRILSDRSPLTPEHTAQLLAWMRPATPTTRLQGDLPAGTIVAHKSGTSDIDNGVAHATNDIGLITLPDGRQLAIAVFVTDSTADTAIREKVIARIARAAYNAAVKNP